MSDPPALTLELLRRAVAGESSAIRCSTRLQPAGGRGDKVFPPTYAVDNDKDATTRYATEKRRIEGQEVTTVLLDSVASQANRMEEALLAGWEAGDLDFPVLTVDFSHEEGIQDLDRVSTLQAPHRIADAIFRDSVTTDGTRFRESPIGAAFTNATVLNATAVFLYCPTALLFGVWDSTGPKGGLGNKFQRALVSEIIGVGSAPGVKTASRLDPLGIQAVAIYHQRGDHDEWTADKNEAELDKKGNPVVFSRKGADGKGKGKASAINHSNIAPTIDKMAGGVTFDHAVQTTVLSLPALRRLRFQADALGERLEGSARASAELAARTALAALALAAVAGLRARGYDLRSRSFLVPEGGTPLEIEFVPSDGGAGPRFHLTAKRAAELLAAAAAAARDAGLPWEREPLRLRPAPKLAALIRESRRVAAEGQTETADPGT